MPLSSMEDLKRRVANWLEKQGYPLEMRATNMAREAGLRAAQGAYYPDPESGAQREIDVVASTSDLTGLLNLSLVIECKASRDKPWVLFTSEQNESGKNRLFSFAISTEAGRRGLAGKLLGEELSSSTWFARSERTAYGITQAFTTGVDVPYAAVVSALKAAIAINGLLANTESDLKELDFSFYFPVVVLDGMLLECFLGPDGDLQVEEVARGVINVVRDIGGERSCAVHVVTVQALPQIFQEFRDVAQMLYGLFKPEIATIFPGVEDMESGM